MRFSGDISLIIPTKNEEGSIGAVIAELPNQLLKEIIVVDARSTDKTCQIVRAHGLEPIEQNGQGYGDAVKTALSHVQGEFVTFFDADGSYDPAMLSVMRNEIVNDYDVVFCSRYMPDSRSDDDTVIRRIGNWFFTRLMRLLYGVRISDALFLYVLAHRSVFEKIDVRSNHFGWCIEFPVRVHQANLRYKEIPSVERPRIAGVSKVNAITDGLKILRTLISLRT